MTVNTVVNGALIQRDMPFPVREDINYACKHHSNACPYNYQCDMCDAHNPLLLNDRTYDAVFRQIDMAASARADALLESDAFANQVRRDLKLYTRPVMFGAKYEPPKDEQPARELNFIQASMFSPRRWWQQ
jgi:hypothetical protein